MMIPKKKIALLSNSKKFHRFSFSSLSLTLHLLLEGDVLDVEADLGSVLDRDTVSAEHLELLDLSVRCVHLIRVARIKNRIWKRKLFKS